MKKSKGNKRVLRADLNLFARIIIIAESRQLQMQEVLLGVLENVRQDERLALKCAAKEYLRRISIIWSSPLSDCNRAQATNCCGATEGSEQKHNQDLKEIYKGRRILEFITFYHNALHLTTLFTTMYCI